MESLLYPEANLDLELSTVGVMLALDREQAASSRKGAGRGEIWLAHGTLYGFRRPVRYPSPSTCAFSIPVGIKPNPGSKCRVAVHLP